MTGHAVHRQSCPICTSQESIRLGSKFGLFERRLFTIQKCLQCSFIFVADPVLDFARLYSRAYYEGRGADASVDYLYELDHPLNTVRALEWRGIVSVIRRLRGSIDGLRWLDFGCGNGGLVRYLRDLGIDAMGFEEGWIAGEASRRGIPILSRAELVASQGHFDVVTAIEVLEHVPEPVALLREIRSALKPGGLLFVTTGNVAPIVDVIGWHYLLPEIHCSLFQPRSLGVAFQRAGFHPEAGQFIPGWEDIYAFKVLKKLRVRQMNPLLHAVPWAPVARVLDSRLQLSCQPTAIAI